MSEEEHTHHGDYVKIWGILVVLLVVSVVGPMAEIQWLTLATAFGIAVVKAYLVVVNFMHIGATPKFVPYLIVVSVLFMVLMFAGVAPDVMKSEGHHWEKPQWLADEAAHAAAQAAGDTGAHH
ncbi:MAG: cytochrome C oxidase subunit IV family protein [Myxococcota bacterium]|jgi:caa(3)-type oxidase subunit IV|nr:cytochrome C oxidase subunit IV family protein [Myxococcota bacterium]